LRVGDSGVWVLEKGATGWIGVQEIWMGYEAQLVQYGRTGMEGLLKDLQSTK
jgi:hypothetical protein